MHLIQTKDMTATIENDSHIISTSTHSTIGETNMYAPGVRYVTYFDVLFMSDEI